MPKIIDRRTGECLGKLTHDEHAQLIALLAEPTRTEEPLPIDPDMLDQFAEAGASKRLLLVLEQVQRGDIDFEPDDDQ
jgi:hypothetical protein